MNEGNPTSDKWHWSKRGSDERNGPVSGEKLKELVEEKELKSDDLVWRKGFEDWKEASSVKELEDFFATPPPLDNAPPLPSNSDEKRSTSENKASSSHRKALSSVGSSETEIVFDKNNNVNTKNLVNTKMKNPDLPGMSDGVNNYHHLRGSKIHTDGNIDIENHKIKNPSKSKYVVDSSIVGTLGELLHDETTIKFSARDVHCFDYFNLYRVRNEGEKNIYLKFVTLIKPFLTKKVGYGEHRWVTSGKDKTKDIMKEIDNMIRGKGKSKPRFKCKHKHSIENGNIEPRLKENCYPYSCAAVGTKSHLVLKFWRKKFGIREEKPWWKSSNTMEKFDLMGDMFSNKKIKTSEYENISVVKDYGEGVIEVRYKEINKETDFIAFRSIDAYRTVKEIMRTGTRS